MRLFLESSPMRATARLRGVACEDDLQARCKRRSSWIPIVCLCATSSHVKGSMICMIGSESVSCFCDSEIHPEIEVGLNTRLLHLDVEVKIEVLRLSFLYHVVGKG